MKRDMRLASDTEKERPRKLHRDKQQHRKMKHQKELDNFEDKSIAKSIEHMSDPNTRSGLLGDK